MTISNVGTASCDDGTVKCDKRTVTLCSSNITCEDETVKCDKKVRKPPNVRKELSHVTKIE